MGSPRKDPRKGLSWQIMLTVLLMLALLCLLMVSTTSSSRFLPNFPGDVTAEPDLGSEDRKGEDEFFQSRRSLSERELVEAVHDFVFERKSAYSPDPEPTPPFIPHCPRGHCLVTNKHGVLYCKKSRKKCHKNK